MATPGINWKSNLDDSALESGAHLEPRTGKDTQHLSILRQGRRHEGLDSGPPSRVREQLKQQRGDAVTLEIVSYYKGNLGFG